MYPVSPIPKVLIFTVSSFSKRQLVFSYSTLSITDVILTSIVSSSITDFPYAKVLIPIVAPVKIGRNSTIGAGSVITQNVKDGNLALTRSAQLQSKYKRKK